jgi:type II restriction enzyme
MALNKELEAEIHSLLRDSILAKIEKYSLNGQDSAKPFQYALFTKKGYLVKGFIHGCETALGTWHETIAKVIARSTFTVSKKLRGSGRLRGQITLEAQSVFDEILSELDGVITAPNHAREAEQIFEASQHDHQSAERIHTVDLFLQTHDDEEIYFEIKGPKPNKNEMRAAKRDLLEIYAMRAKEGKRVRTFLGMYYNPYDPHEYQRWTCLRYFDQGSDFLVGRGFWDFLGGPGTYEDLIRIFEVVGEEVRPSLERKLCDLGSANAASV